MGIDLIRMELHSLSGSAGGPLIDPAQRRVPLQYDNCTGDVALGQAALPQPVGEPYRQRRAGRPACSAWGYSSKAATAVSQDRRAAGDGVARSRDIAGIVGGKKDEQRRHLLGLAWSLHWHLRAKAFDLLG